MNKFDKYAIMTGNNGLTRFNYKEMYLQKADKINDYQLYRVYSYSTLTAVLVCKYGKHVGVYDIDMIVTSVINSKITSNQLSQLFFELSVAHNVGHTSISNAMNENEYNIIKENTCKCAIYEILKAKR